MKGDVRAGDLLPFNRSRVCLCCGIPLEKGRKRYCSSRCREEFLFKLGWFNNLLRALNTRYATFFFTPSVLSLNVLPFESEDVFSFFFERRRGVKPAIDMERMVFHLGEMWWSFLRQKGSREEASRCLLLKGHKRIFSLKSISPRIYTGVCGVGKELMFLRLTREELLRCRDPYSVVKQAYKRCALEVHPDMGGDEKRFIQIYNSYQRLISWLKAPSLYRRKGVPGHWFFEHGRSNWYSPL